MFRKKQINNKDLGWRHFNCPIEPLPPREDVASHGDPGLPDQVPPGEVVGHVVPDRRDGGAAGGGALEGRRRPHARGKGGRQPLQQPRRQRKVGRVPQKDR